MTNSLLLHVGSPKTATTLVQRHFSSTDVLAANGVHYPGPGRNPNRFAHHGLGLMLMDCRDAEAAALLGKELAPRGMTLVSSESMTNCMAAPRRMGSFRAFLGAMAAWVLGRCVPDWTTRFLIIVASGLIAGESLSGVVLAVVEILGG